jgi:CrcB protein
MRTRLPKKKFPRNLPLKSLRRGEPPRRRGFSLNSLLNLIRNDGWLMKVLFVMLGGSIGALSRYSVSLFAARFLGARFPFGTLIVNLSGCFLIGLSFALADRGLNIMNPSARLFFMTGFLGALTTFSTFALETVNSIRADAYLLGAANFLFNNLVGAASVFLGMWLGGLK